MSRKAQLCLCFLLAFQLAVPSFAQQAGVSPLRRKAEVMKRYLNNKGFTVKEGLFLPLNAVDWYCAGILYSCNMNNAGAPYNIVLPPAPDGGYGTKTEAPSFRMRRDEAIVLVGPTPPKCKYYSYSLFLWYRWDQAQGRTRKLFDTLGQPLNRFLLNTGGSDFDKNIVLSFTCDKRVDKDVREAAKDAGFPEDVLNTYVVPSSGLNTDNALDEQSDSMVIVQRTALFADPNNANPETAERPIVFRVTPTNPTPAAQLKPFPAPELRVRGTGKTELDWAPAVETLRQSILASYPGRRPEEYTTIQYLMQSPIAIQSWVNTLGDSSDTTYLGTQENFKLADDPEDFLIVYGVNHAKTEKALYANINVYKACALCGVATVFNVTSGNQQGYENTALDYLRGPQPFDPSYLFAYKISRNCNGDPHCLTVPTSEECRNGAAPNDDLVLGFRAYLEPKTKTGPSYTELQFEKVLHYTAPAPQLQGPDHPPQGAPNSPIPVELHATSQSSGALRWQADYEYIDNPCCGTLAPKQGEVGPDGHIRFVFTPNRVGTFFVEVTVLDEMDRQACSEVVIESVALAPTEAGTNAGKGPANAGPLP
jgi:hypothetical protein